MDPIRSIRSLSTAVRVLSIIARVFLCIFIALSLLCLTFFLVMPNDALHLQLDNDLSMHMQGTLFDTVLSDISQEGTLYENDDVRVQKDGNALTVELAAAPSQGFTFRHVALLIIPMCMQLIALLVVFCFIGAFAKALRSSHSPFGDTVVSRLKGVGWSLLGWAIAPMLSGILCTACAYAFDLSLESSFSVMMRIDLPIVLFVLLFLLLVYIFSYGAKLQRESDTTL